MPCWDQGCYSFGDDESDLGDYAWYEDNSGGQREGPKYHPVGSKLPNPWGLHDMHGNVWEWGQGWYDDYPSGAVTDPTGPSSGSSRVYRGGGWGSAMDFLAGRSREFRLHESRSTASTASAFALL